MRSRGHSRIKSRWQTFRPGARFVSDYQTFYVRRHQGDFQFNFHDENQAIGEPHQVAYLFVEKRTGQKRDGIPYVSSKDVETAKELLRTISLDRMGDFLDFALSEARRTRFDLQTLGGVRQYLNNYLQTSDRRATEKAKTSARLVQEAEEQLRSEYAGYLRTAAGKLLESRPAHERAVVEDLARAKARPPIGGTGFLSNTLFELERTRLTIDRYPDQVLSFDQWKASVTH